MPLFTTSRIDQAFERFMKHHVSPAGSVGAGVHRTPAPKYKTDSPEADYIQSILDAEKEWKGRCPMIYRDDRHQRTFEKEKSMRPESINRRFLAALYLLTADGSLWNQVRDQAALRKIYIDEMRPKNLSGTSYVFFSAAKDILTGTRNIQLMEIADPALLSMKSYLILCTALAIRAFGLEQAHRIQFERRWE